MYGAADISGIIRRECEHIAKGIQSAMKEDFHRACDQMAEREWLQMKCRCPMRPPVEDRDTSNCPVCRRPW